MLMIIIKVVAIEECRVHRSKNKNRWEYELRSLGIYFGRNCDNDSNDLKENEDLEVLANIIKQSLYHGFKLAYGKDGDKYQEEAEATVKP
jgi:hypothetical protein